MADIEVIEVESKSDLNKFINYPNKLYKDDSNYVAPLNVERKEFFDHKKNPFFKFARVKLFLAQKNGETCGRIATCVNYQHNEYHDEQMGAFGFFDCPDDFEVASTLLKVAMITLKREGMEIMKGPLNFSTNHECGFLVEGFDSPPVVMMTYNQPYIPALAEKVLVPGGITMSIAKDLFQKVFPGQEATLTIVIENTNKEYEMKTVEVEVDISPGLPSFTNVATQHTLRLGQVKHLLT